MEKSQLVDEIFLEAVNLPPTDRSTFLDKRCAGMSPAIRLEVEKLLAGDDQADQAKFSALQLNVAAMVATTDGDSSDAVEQNIGPYRLLQKLGEGGMGVVYMAEQKTPVRRRVAIKLVKPGMDTKQVLARFEAERQALAMMEHPNIAKVFDVGQTKFGRPFFVMELVKGVPIAKYCDENQLSIKQRLRIFVSVCNAVQHAHQKGVIHRDLKPSNILVAEYDNDPVAKVIDFGLAKAMQQSLTEKTMFTRFDQIVGTYEYMSPEQAKFNQLDIDTRTDIYSLGVLLYELLSGTTPLDGETLRSAAIDELLRVIREVDPLRPSSRLSNSATAATVAKNRSVNPPQLDSLLRGDLDSIVMKTLEKERNRRYETCSALADDVRRFLNDQPVEAAPPSTVYYAIRFIRRNRSAVVAGSVFVLTLVVATLLSTMLWLRSVKLAGDLSVKEVQLEARVDQLQKTTDQLRGSRYRTEMALASQALSQSNLPRAYDLLESQIPSDDTAKDPRGLEWYVFASLCKSNQGVLIADQFKWCVSQDRRTIATINNDSIFTIDVATGTKTRFDVKSDLTATSPDLAAISNDRSRLVSQIPDGLRIDDLPSGKTYYVSGHDKNHPVVAMSPDGELGANATSTGKIQVWDTDSGDILWSKQATDSSLQFISFTDDSRQLITVLKRTEEGVIVWNARNGEQFQITTDESFRPDDADILRGNRLLMGGGGGLKVVDLSGVNQGPQPNWVPDVKPISCLAVSQDDKLLALGTRRNSVQIWNLETRSLVWQTTLTRRTVAMQFANGDTELLVGTMNGLEQHSFGKNLNSTSLSASSRFYWPDRVDISSGTVLLAAPQHGVVSWKPVSGAERTIRVPIGSESLQVLSVAADPTSSTVAVTSASPEEGNNTRVLATIDLATEALVREFDLKQDDNPYSLDYFADGKRLASGNQRGAAIWNTETGQAEWRFENSESLITIVRLAPDNSKLAGGNWGGTVYVWNVEHAPKIIKELKQSDAIFAMAWSPDKRWFVAGDASGTVVVYDTKDFSKHVELPGHSDPLQTLTFSPDGTVLLSGALDGRVKLWNVANWFETAELNYDKPVHAVRCIATKDKQRLGILVGTREMHNDPSDVRVHWIDIDRTADRSWLRQRKQIGAE